MIEALVIEIEMIDDKPIATIRILRDPTLQDLQIVVGGLIEAIPTSGDVTIWVNEEGKYLTPIRNHLAEIVWAHCDPYGCLAAGDWIAGSVVIQGGVDSRGESTTAPQWVRDMAPTLPWGVTA